MIDLHSHILPAVDDGSSSVNESTRMIKRWADMGFDLVVATPHLRGDVPAEYQARIEEARAEIEPELEEANLELRTGFEIMLDPDLPRRLTEGAPIRLGGSQAILVEVPF